MNKAQLIEVLVKDKEARFESKAAAERALNSVVEAIKKGVKKDNSVQLIGFGTFSVRKRKARKGRNPRTGEPIRIRASKTVAFKSSKNFKP